MKRETATLDDRIGPHADFYRSALMKLAGADTPQNRSLFAAAAALNGKTDAQAQRDLRLVKTLNAELDAAPSARVWRNIRASQLRRHGHLIG